LLIVKVITFLVFIAPLLTLMIIHSIYYYYSHRYRSPVRVNSKSNTGITIVVPVKNEPIELIDDLVKNVDEACRGFRCELLIVTDDPVDRALEIKNLCESKRTSSNVEVRVILGDPISGSRAKALNKGVTEAKYEYIMILDVDSRLQEGTIDKLINCVESGYEACVGRWESYYSYSTRLAKSIGRTMKFTVDTLYKGRSALNLFIFPLGSGTLFRKESLLTVGLWDNVIQDDMYMGMKFLANGFKVGYVDDAVINVLVPSYYTSLKIQQERWAYGALEVLLKTFKLLLKAKLSVIKRLEAALYLCQYIPTALLFLGSVVIPITSIFLREDLMDFGYVLIAFSTVVTALYVLSIYKSLINRYVSKYLIIRSIGSSATTTATLLPTIFVGTVKALLLRRFRYNITPKGSSEKLVKSLRNYEYLYLIYLLIVLIFNALLGNVLTALWCGSIALAIIYTSIRVNKVVNY